MDKGYHPKILFPTRISFISCREGDRDLLVQRLANYLTPRRNYPNNDYSELIKTLQDGSDEIGNTGKQWIHGSS